MEKNGREKNNSRSSVKDYLLYRPDKRAGEIVPLGHDFENPEVLRKKFPRMLTGKAFLGKRDMLFKEDVFGALGIKIDPLENGSSEVVTDVADIINSICLEEAGIWGAVGPGMIGCFFPGKDEDSMLKLAQRTAKELGSKREETVTLGVAIYPFLDYPKEKIMENAGKAIDHAAFFGPGSIVAFDATSINISGDRLYQEGDIKGAVAEFKRALGLEPSNSNLYNSLGVCYGVAGHLEKALASFKRASEIDPREVMPFYNSGIVHMFSDNRGKALKCLLRARELGEERFEVVFQTGRLYLETGEIEKGKEALLKAASIKPESASVFRYLGDCHMEAGMLEDALSAYKKAIRNNPFDSKALSSLGLIFDMKGENPEISALFCRQSVSISPENGLFRRRLGKLYLKQNLLDEALTEFMEAEKLGVNSLEYIKKAQKQITAQADNQEYIA